jgi:diguanylate cyclase (GGDEF)-like protein
MKGDHTELEPELSIPSTLHLLIIEDVQEDAELLLLTLQDADINYTYDQIATAIACQQCLTNQVYDAVLSDYRLPNSNGLQAFELVKQSGQDIPFILITGSLGEEAAVECIKAGMTDYVLKDRLFRLPSVLQRALDEFALRREQKVAIAQIRQQAQREAIINRIVQAMRETLVLDEVLQTTANQLHEALQVSRCLISQPDEQQQFCVKYVSHGTLEGPELMGHPCLFYDHYQDALKEGRQVAFSHLDRELPPEIAQFTKDYSSHAVLITPLLYQQTYLGGISLCQCDHDRVWSENELALVKAIADQCAIAIHQAYLYQSAQTELAERKKIEAQLRHDALHDALTDLPNRALFLDRLHHALHMYQRRSHPSDRKGRGQFAVLFLDLDRFKVINDSLGHAVGDQLLQIVAQRLTSALRSGDTVARLGGDEFVMLLEDINTVKDAIDAVHRVHQSLKAPIFLDSHEVFVSTSVGIVLSDIHYTQPAQLLRDADIAMYRAKTNRRGSYEVFSPAMHVQAVRQLELESDLCRAIERQELQVFYQPIIALNSEQIQGFEALVRWQHPDRGLIMPDEFISIAEDIGLIIPIDMWVLREACRQLRQWQTHLPQTDSLFMCVNLSGKQFSQPDLMAKIDQVLGEVALSPACLKIELTESVLIESTTFATEVLDQLCERNIRVCIDDFGTGYSSLSYLHRFPIHTLKIDRSFISRLDAKPGNYEIVKAIVNLGLNLGLHIVAEGVESLDQVRFLQMQGCHAGQGYYFARPLDAVAATKLVAQRMIDVSVTA